MSTYYQEKRRSPRMEINAPGRVIAVSRRLRVEKVIPCKIIDISQGGALIELKHDDIENDFYLEMDSEPEKRMTCTVVRRDSLHRVGVKFVPLA
ncbi:MAG TPA: PilZ domain-containing protein [Beijerinckiaceae bacterium]|jgi:hypothetical protein|nr:PilZ domain-containing protein [Beijerinckiaceae bacterium]